jgi:polynucleotide 5'-kinase involved in rRNA processing
MEKRKKLREMSYAKYLMDAKVKSWLLNQVRIEEKNVESIKHGEEKGLLLGLYDSQGKFFGIGILLEVDRTRKTLKVLTPVTKKPAFVAVGKVRLDENLREIVNALE